MAAWVPPLSPLPPVASKYNLKRVHPIYGTVIPHTGVDYAAPAGTPVYAVADGVVERSAYDAPRWQGGTGAGNHVRLNHGSGVTSRYYHLSVRYLAQGERVRAGQRVGLVGATGDATGPHLHFEIRVDGTPVDPTAYMSRQIGEIMPNFGDRPDISAAAKDALNGNTPSWETLLGYSGAGGFAAMRDLPEIKAALARLEAREVTPVDPVEVAAALAPMLEEAVVAELTGAGLLTADTAGPVMEAALRRVFAQLGDPA